ncbi:MAG: lipopolysaccharide biosynthesis protein [Pseudonocardiales bacterium]|nr:MAG: lipopolysaccharide biosynthesis protein [Pseudonocardiales bacterium]
MTSTPGRTPATEDPDAPGFAQTGRQVSWNYLVFALSKSSTLIMTVILARILTAADFGLFALALLVLNVFDYAKDLGVTLALVQQRGPWRRLAPTGLTLSVAFGVLASAAALSLAPIIASALRHPELVPMVQVLGAGLLISSLGAVPVSLLRRRIDFRGRLVPEVSGALVKTVLSVGLALAGLGVWSLVWGQLAASVLTALMYWGVARTAVRPGFDRTVAVELARFGLPATLVSLVAFGIYNCDYVAIGRQLGDEQLGFYTLAYRLPELVVLMLCNTVSEVLFSSLSRWQHDRAALADHYLRAVRVVLALTAPLGFGMAALAPEVVEVLYGRDYSESANELAVLAVFTVVYSVTFHSGDVYKATGRPGLLTLINLGKFVVLAPAVWFAAHRDILAVAVAVLMVEVMHCAVRLFVIRWVIGITFSRQVRTFSGPLAAGAGMAILVWSAAHLVESGSLAVRVPVLLALGGVLYTGFVGLCAPDLFRQGTAVLRTFRKSWSTGGGGSQ